MTQDEQIERVGLPSSPQIERTVLGAMLLDSDACSDALTRLQPDDFYIESHQRVFKAISHVAKRGQGVDTATVAVELRRRREMPSIGGEGWFSDLTTGIPRKLHVEDYCRIIRDKARMREAIKISEAITQRGLDGSEESQDVIESAIERLREVVEDHEDYDLETAGEYFDRQSAEDSSIESMAAQDGVPTGFPSLDEVLSGGMQRGDLIIVAARPSMGKTAWACNVAHHIAVRQGKAVVMFSLEQKRKSLLRRMMSSAARVDLKAILERRLRAEDVRILTEKREQIAGARLYIDDKPGQTASRIRAKCMRLKSRLAVRGIELSAILIDQLSHVDGADVYTRGMDLRQIIGKQTKAFKKLVQELNVPVVVFNQLGRDVGKRSDPKPRLEDLKESGNIEEDADVVIFLHRPEYYDKADAALKGVGEMIVAKQRDGETKTVECEYQGRIVRWEDASQPAAKQSALTGFSSPEEQYFHDYGMDRNRIKW